MSRSHSQRQLYTIKTFGTKEMGSQLLLHSGPFGVGKTYSLVQAFGLYCCKLQALGITGLNFVLLGKTQSAVKKNMCNVLSKLYGNDFNYDNSRKSGTVKDATLFGQNLYIIGLNDSSSESKFRGLSEIMGVLHDEAVLCTREQFDLIMSRLRGEINISLPDSFIRQWYIGSTNPDIPTHFLLDYVNKGIMKMVKWRMQDACWNGATEYYNRLKALYKDNQQFYSRYLLGEWTGAENLVYPMFNFKKHVLDIKDTEVVYKDFKRHILAVDYGSSHPTAIVLVSLSWTGEYIISMELKLRHTAPSDIVSKISEFYRYLEDKGVGINSLYIDPSSRALKDELTKRGIAYKNAMNSHNDGIGYIRNMLTMNKLFIMSDCNESISEMYSYRFKENNTGKDEVYKVDDDLVDAIRYAVYTDSVIGI